MKSTTKRGATSNADAAASVVLKVVSEDKSVGFGEGIARPYVTEETVESLIRQAQSRFCMFETAILDCLLKSSHRSIGQIIPPKRDSVTYSGVISTGSVQKVSRIAKHFGAMGLKGVKVKIGDENDVERIGLVRDILGLGVSLRVDANGAYDFEQAARKLNEFSKLGVECVEQPLSRALSSQLPKLRTKSPIPIMVDESLITMDDARQLIAEKACDYFNLRVAKCGGLSKTLQIAELAAKSGIRLQLGAQVGETAILSAVGRCVAAHLERVDYVEGSFGTMLLTEDMAAENINFGPGGVAPVLHGEGFGIHVLEEHLQKYTHRITECGKVNS